MPVLWNTAKKKIEGRHDGKFFYFAPDERKLIQDTVISSFLQVQLEQFGLVTLAENPTKEMCEKAKLVGLKNRWKWCDSMVRNWQAKNKERESMKMAGEAPNDAESDCALEAGELIEEINLLDSGKTERMNSYLKDEKTQKAQEAAKKMTSGIENDGMKATIKEGKNAVHATVDTVKSSV